MLENPVSISMMSITVKAYISNITQASQGGLSESFVFQQGPASGLALDQAAQSSSAVHQSTSLSMSKPRMSCLSDTSLRSMPCNSWKSSSD